MIKEIKIFDTSHDDISMEDAINEWLVENDKIEVISTDLAWDQSNLVYTILYSRERIDLPG